MTKTGLNLNNKANIATFIQMLGGGKLCNSSKLNNKDLAISLFANMALSYAPQVLDGVVNTVSGGISRARSEREEAKKAEELIPEILKTVELENNEALRRDLLNKYSVMTSVAKQNGEKLSDNEIQTRLTNYAKGWKFNQFQTKVAMGLNVPEYQSDCAKAKSLPELKEAYDQFAKEYIEFYDQDKDNKINIEEMFFQKLIEHYSLKKGLSTSEAKRKARETLQYYQANNYGLLNDGTINLPEDGTDEAQLYSLILDKLARMEQSLNIKNNAQFDQEEIAVYLHAMANFKDAGNNITSSDAFQMNLSSVDNETTIFENRLKASKEYLDSIK